MSNKHICLGLVAILGASLIPQSAFAQYNSGYNQAPPIDRYAYCQQQAQRMSGYYGQSPGRYREGNALRKAAKQSRNVDAIAWLAGADKKKRKKLRQKAALDGFLKGAIQRGIQEDRDRKARERYDYELRTCMSAG